MLPHQWIPTRPCTAGTLLNLDLHLIQCTTGNCARTRCISYLFYINDISRKNSSYTKLFAEDMKVYRALRYAKEDMEELQKDLGTMNGNWNLTLINANVFRKRLIIQALNTFYVVTSWKLYLKSTTLEFTLFQTCHGACESPNVQMRQTVYLDL